MLFLLALLLWWYYIYTMAMAKQMVSLTDPQVVYLRTEAGRLGISVSDLIRRIIDQHRTSGLSAEPN